MALHDSPQDSRDKQQRETPVELDTLILDSEILFGLTSHYLKRKKKVIAPFTFACFFKLHIAVKYSKVKPILSLFIKKNKIKIISAPRTVPSKRPEKCFMSFLISRVKQL